MFFYKESFTNSNAGKNLDIKTGQLSMHDENKIRGGAGFLWRDGLSLMQSDGRYTTFPTGECHQTKISTGLFEFDLKKNLQFLPGIIKPYLRD